MKASATERSSAYELTWTLTTMSPTDSANDDALKLDYAITASEELYISDRLWDDDAAQHRIPDPFGVYRFVHDGSLRLVFAQAPYPPNVKLGKTYPPLYSRILAGETRRQSVTIELPVDEYSSLGRNISAPTVLEDVTKVVFVLGYQLRSTLDRAPTPPPRETADAAGYIVYEPELIISELRVDRLQVKRRTGYIARFPLPGEPGPAPMPIELLR